MKSLLITLFVFATLLPRGWACCMLPATYQGTIGQNAQEAVIFHHDGVQEMILRIKYRIEGQGLPDRFAWVITVPNQPDQYAVADKNLYEQVFRWASPLVTPPPPRSIGCAASMPTASAVGDLEFGERVKVGPYDIQPVRALGAEALTGLNAWLKANGFPTEDPGHMKYFVENKFTFLAIKINPAEGADAVGEGGELEPLHLTFESEKVYYPLRFSSRQGVFRVNLTLLTRNKVDFKKSEAALEKIAWSSHRLHKNVKVTRDTFPDALATVFENTTFKDLESEYWFLNVIRTRGTNRGNSIATWDADVFFETGGALAGPRKPFIFF